MEMIAALKPDFAILDLNMPGISGIEVIRRLRASGCTAKLLILSISREEATVVETLRAGADAYLLREEPLRHLLDAIGFVRDGGVYVSPLLRGPGLFTRAESSRAEDPLASLSAREREEEELAALRMSSYWKCDHLYPVDGPAATPRVQ